MDLFALANVRTLDPEPELPVAPQHMLAPYRAGKTTLRRELERERAESFTEACRREMEGAGAAMKQNALASLWGPPEERSHPYGDVFDDALKRYYEGTMAKLSESQVPLLDWMKEHPGPAPVKVISSPAMPEGQAMMFDGRTFPQWKSHVVPQMITFGRPTFGRPEPDDQADGYEVRMAYTAKLHANPPRQAALSLDDFYRAHQRIMAQGARPREVWMAPDVYREMGDYLDPDSVEAILRGALDGIAYQRHLAVRLLEAA